MDEVKEILFYNLAIFLSKKGKEYTNKNYFKIKSIFNVLTDLKLLKLVEDIKKQYAPKSPIIGKVKEILDIHTLPHNRIRKYLYEKNISIDYLPIVSLFIRRNGDIISAVEYFIKGIDRSIAYPIFLDDSEFKTHLVRWTTNPYLSLRIFNNTSLDGLKKFIDRYSKQIKEIIKSQKGLEEYPHFKRGKVDYFQTFIEYLGTIEKRKAKQKNRYLKNENKNTENFDWQRYIQPDTDSEIAPKLLGNKYYDRKYSKKGANLLRTRRKRLLANLKSQE